MTTSLKTTSFLLLFVLLSAFFTKSTQAQNDPEQLAKDFVENGNYSEALPYFEDLVHLYPQDKELNYYLGMCLVETEDFSQQAKNALQIALGDDTPAKSFYYLGQCFHAENNFSEALQYYRQYDKEAKKREKRSTRIDELIELCEQQVNPFPVPEEEIVEEQEETAAPEEERIPEVVEIPTGLADSLINFQVNATIKYLNIDQFNSKNSLNAFVKAWQAEQDLNNIQEQTSRLRNAYKTALASNKNEIAEQILQLEKETYQQTQAINQFYAEARALEKAYWDGQSAQSIQDFALQVRQMEDSIRHAREQKRIEKLEAQKPIVLPDSLVKTMLPEEPVVVDKGVVYKIQIGAYSKTPPDWVQRLYKKLAIIRRIDQYTDEKGVTVYTVGELKSYNDALQMQSQVRTEGVKDAFIAAYQDGQRISVQEARKISEE